MPDQTAHELTQRDTFKLFTPVTIRFCDTDKLGHVNNVAIAAYFEASRCELFDRLLQRAGHMADTNIDYVLARVAIDFKREVHYPGTVEVGGRFLRIGNRSVLSGYGAFIGGQCFATAEAVTVFFDLKTRTAVSPPSAFRRLLEAELAA
jgi:acyl-CoA thioester hydrolase